MKRIKMIFYKKNNLTKKTIFFIIFRMLCAKRKLLWTDFNVDAAAMILRFTFNENIDQFEINKYERCLMKLKFKKYSHLKSKRD